MIKRPLHGLATNSVRNAPGGHTPVRIALAQGTARDGGMVDAGGIQRSSRGCHVV